MEVTPAISNERLEQSEGQPVTIDPLFRQSGEPRASASTGSDKLSDFNGKTDGKEHEPCANLSTEAPLRLSPTYSQTEEQGQTEAKDRKDTTRDGLPLFQRTESKLRVSVYDHRFIPKKFIPGRILANRNTESALNITNGAKPSNFDINSNSMSTHKQDKTSDFDVHKRKAAMHLQVALRQKRCSWKGSAGNSPVDSSDTDGVRTRFDDLLRGLIGDVNDMAVQSSPVTISSGYESGDYLPTKENEIDDIFNKSVQRQQNKENVKKSEEIPTDYFSETYPNSELSHPMKENRAFTSLPSFPTQSSMEADAPCAPEAKEAPVLRTVKTDNDINGFSYTQRHNYKLTKVTRSMYEIIHDLQNVDKTAPIDGRKRSRKGRRTEGAAPTDENSSARENKPSFGRFNSASETNKSYTSSLTRNRDNNMKSLSGAVVRCVRRPLGSNESTIRLRARKTSYCDSVARSGSMAGQDNADRLQTDLRNLLCDTEELTVHGNNDNDPCRVFNEPSRLNSQINPLVSDFNENRLNPSSRIPELALPSSEDITAKTNLNSQFASRAKPEDHVYETIPGDEKLYEEWKKLRATSKVPRIRRFTTVPDLPGTFVPKEPPALPERRYLQPFPKHNDNYICMGDGHSNASSNSSSTSDKTDSGYTSMSSDKMLSDSRPPPVTCYPMQTDTFPGVTFRNDETSDGYCSIDNLSVLREPIKTSSYPEQNLSSALVHSWSPPQLNGVHRFPHNNNNKNSNRTFFPQSTRFHHHNQIPDAMESERKLTGMMHFEYRKSDGSDSDSTLVSSVFDREVTKQIVQATYV